MSNQNIITRRLFIEKVTIGSILSALFMALLGILRFPLPKVLKEKTRFKIGKIDEFPLNTFTFMGDKKIFIYRDRTSLKALSAVCTHLGCIINKTPNGFRCPCHGSYFNPQGEVLSGPAPRALSWYKIEMGPGGQLIVDISKRVNADESYII